MFNLHEIQLIIIQEKICESFPCTFQHFTHTKTSDNSHTIQPTMIKNANGKMKNVFGADWD